MNLLVMVLLLGPQILKQHKTTDVVKGGQRLMQLSSITPTNIITRLTFTWNVYTNTYTSIVLVFGSSSGLYTNLLDCGRTNVYKFAATNWMERKIPHYFAVEARLNVSSNYILFSLPSNEVRWPPYPGDRLELTWSNLMPTFVESTVDWTNWSLVTLTTTNRLVIMDPLVNTFYRLRQVNPPAADRLTIRHFNPLN